MSGKHITYNYNLSYILSVFIMLNNAHLICAQDPVIFLDRSDLIGTLSDRPNVSTAVADINGDYRDDVIQFNDKGELLFHIQIDDGASFLTHGPIAYPLDKVPTTLNIGDFDNSGVNDLLSAGFYNGISIISGQEGLIAPVVKDSLDIRLFAQGSSLIDVNNDGWLDVMLSHDDGANILLINDGAGQFIDSKLIDFNTVPASDNSGNYSSIWFDADSDDDLDLYIAKCRVDVDDTSDPRRINALYINDNGRFREAASTYGLDIGDQSWAVDSGDIDNDGDIDLVIINHGAPHIILEQKVDTFIRHKLTHLGEALMTEDLQVSIADFNNDGLQDIIITGIDDYLLLNRGNFDFLVDTNPFGFKKAATFALGDINEDGYTDAYVGFLSPQDELWINNGGSNNYAKFSLNGVQSNRSGIGSKISVHTADNTYVRWLKSGVSYGITNSLNVNFGLASEAEIDSVVCLWPSGIRDVYYDVKVNEHYVLTESVCMQIINHIDTDDKVINCDDDVIVLSSTITDDNLWNNGVLSDSIIVTQPGLYYTTNSETCRNVSQIIEINEEAIVKPKLSQSGVINICADTELILTHDQAIRLHWSSDEEGPSIEITEPGQYYAFSDEDCKDFYSDTLIVDYVEFDAGGIIEIYNGALMDTLLTTEYGNVVWYSDSLGMSIITELDSIEILNIENDTIFYFSQIIPTIGDSIYDCFSEILQYEIIIDSLTSIDHESLRKFKVYPNPVKDMMYLESDLPVDNIHIYDFSGAVVHTFDKVENNSYIVRIEDLASGLYIIEVYADNRYYRRKFIKL